MKKAVTEEAAACSRHPSIYMALRAVVVAVTARASVQHSIRRAVIYDITNSETETF